MKKILFLLVMIALIAGGSVSAGESFTGHISDSKCGAGHSDASAKSISGVKGCVGGGASAVFITEDKTVVKIANQDKVKGHLGHQVKVTGTLKDGTLTIKSLQHLAP